SPMISSTFSTTLLHERLHFVPPLRGSRRCGSGRAYTDRSSRLSHPTTAERSASSLKWTVPWCTTRGSRRSSERTSASARERNSERVFGVTSADRGMRPGNVLLASSAERDHRPELVLSW